MEFTDVNHSWQYLAENAIDTTGGSSTFKIDWGSSLSGIMAAGTNSKLWLSSTNITLAALADEATYDTLHTTLGLTADWNETTVNQIDAITNGGKTFDSTTTSQGGALMLAAIGYHGGVEIRSAKNITFRNCKFSGFAEYCISLQNCDNITIDNCTFDDAKWGSLYGGPGIKLQGCRNVKIINCTFRNRPSGVLVNGIAITNFKSRVGAHNLTIDNCTFDQVQRSIRCTNNTPVQGVKISNNTFTPLIVHKDRVSIDESRQDFGSTAIDIIGRDISIHDNTIHGNIDQPNVSYSESAYQDQGDGFTWVDGYVNNNRYYGHMYGIRVQIAITQNAITEPTLSIQNNTIKAFRGGISIVPQQGFLGTAKATYGINVSGNSIDMQNGVGIYLWYGDTRCTGIYTLSITNNQVRNNFRTLLAWPRWEGDMNSENKSSTYGTSIPNGGSNVRTDLTTFDDKPYTGCLMIHGTPLGNSNTNIRRNELWTINGNTFYAQWAPDTEQTPDHYTITNVLFGLVHYKEECNSAFPSITRNVTMTSISGGKHALKVQSVLKNGDVAGPGGGEKDVTRPSNSFYFANAVFSVCNFEAPSAIFPTEYSTGGGEGDEFNPAGRPWQGGSNEWDRGKMANNWIGGGWHDTFN